MGHDAIWSLHLWGQKIMELLTKSQYKKLTDNHIKHKELWNQDSPVYKDFKVVVKLFNPTGIGTWWISELDPQTKNCYGVAHLFEKEAGYFNLNELKDFKGQFGLGIERDKYFTPNKYSIEDILEDNE